jgi:heat shock protein HtpX
METCVHQPLIFACHHQGMARPAQFGKDTGLQVRMLTTMFLLGLVYIVFAGVIFAAGGSGIAIVLFAVVMLSFQSFASDKLALRAMGAREVSAAEAPELHAMIDRLCIQADIPKPRIAVADTQMPNAFALGRSQKHATVCATTGILNLLSPSELEGVMAHEITHIVNRDVAIMTMASFFASIAAMIVRFGFFFGGGFGGGYGNSDDEDNSGVMMLILVSALVYAISFLLMQALSRYREYAADRGSAVITGRPSALSSALLKLNGAMQRTPTQDLRAAGEMNAFFIVPANVKNSIYGLFATHPPMEKRIEALSRLESQLQQGARPVAA